MSHVVISGASTGIGRDIQLYLIAAGHQVSVFRRSVGAAMDMDLIGRKAQINAVLLCQRYRGAITDEWQAEIDTSLLRSRQILDAAGNKLANASIVVMASVAGVSVEEEQPVSYHACKAALIEMVKYYAVTLGPKQIRVNAIIPGLTIKPEARGFYDAHPELERLYTDCTPLGRMGTVQDIANLVDFLITDKSSYLTGQTITLDGGISLRSHWSLARRCTPSLRTLPVTQRSTHMADSNLGPAIAPTADNMPKPAPSVTPVNTPEGGTGTLTTQVLPAQSLGDVAKAGSR